MRASTRRDLLQQISGDDIRVGLSMQVRDIPNQTAGTRTCDGEANHAPVRFGYPGAVATGTMSERGRNKVQVREAPTFRLDTRPGVRRDLGCAGASLERCKRDHVDGAQRAN